MSKKISAHYDNETKRIIIDTDEVQQGDYIDLSNLSSLDSYIKNEIDKKYKNTILDEYKNSDSFKKILNEKESLIKEIDQLKQNEELQKVEYKSKIDQAILKFKDSNEYKELYDAKSQLESANKNKKLEIEAAILKNNKEIESKYNSKIEISNNEINNLKNQLKQIELEKDSLVKNKQIEIENAILNFKDTEEYRDLLNVKKNHEEKINSLQLEYDKKYSLLQTKIQDLQREHDSKTIKSIGEELEQYCYREYTEKFDQIEDTLFKKTTVAKDGTKPDFQLTIYDENITGKCDDEKWLKQHLIGNAIFEMKTEMSSSENKKKNDDHLKKLESDRIKFEADTAILVTELERDDIFQIRRSKTYPNIYLIRPIMFSAIIGLYRTMIIKNKKMHRDDIEFRTKEEILKDFDEFKNDLLEKQFDKINKQCENISKHAQKIIDSGDEIKKSIGVISEVHMSALKNKIENFKIEKKVLKRIPNSSENKTNELENEIDSKLVIK